MSSFDKVLHTNLMFYIPVKFDNDRKRCDLLRKKYIFENLRKCNKSFSSCIQTFKTPIGMTEAIPIALQTEKSKLQIFSLGLK